MRLIDADKLKMCYTGTNGLDDKAEYFSIRKMIDLQHTAYDVDKVAKQLEELREEILLDTSYDNDTVNHYLGYVDLMIEAVKSGDIE